MAQEPQKTDIADELNKLGNQVADALRLAWESDERKRLQTEIVDGMQKFSGQVNEAMKRASESDAARKVRVQAQEAVTKAQQSDVVDDVRAGLLSGLQSINRELSRLLERMEAGQPAAPARPEETGFPPEPPATL